VNFLGMTEIIVIPARKATDFIRTQKKIITFVDKMRI